MGDKDLENANRFFILKYCPCKWNVHLKFTSKMRPELNWLRGPTPNNSPVCFIFIFISNQCYFVVYTGDLLWDWFSCVCRGGAAVHRLVAAGRAALLLVPLLRQLWRWDAPETEEECRMPTRTADHAVTHHHFHHHVGFAFRTSMCTYLCNV